VSEKLGQSAITYATDGERRAVSRDHKESSGDGGSTNIHRLSELFGRRKGVGQHLFPIHTKECERLSFFSGICESSSGAHQVVREFLRHFSRTLLANTEGIVSGSSVTPSMVGEKISLIDPSGKPP
jgi:hypothetical protein